jgi:hypothetical protein
MSVPHFRIPHTQFLNHLPTRPQQHQHPEPSPRGINTARQGFKPLPATAPVLAVRMPNSGIPNLTQQRSH